MQPALGQTVLYQPPGMPGQPLPAPWAAIMLGVCTNPDQIRLKVMPPYESDFRCAASNASQPTPGCWHWPAAATSPQAGEADNTTITTERPHP